MDTRFFSVAIALAAALAAPWAPAALAGARALVVLEDGVQFRVSSAMGAAETDAEFLHPAKHSAGFLRGLRPGPAQILGPVAVIPLLAPAPPEPAAIGSAAGDTPADARDSGAIQQTIDNRVQRLRMGLIGQILEGPRTQDRGLERSQLIGPRSRSLATAFCCEEKFLAQVGEPLTMTAHVLPVRARAGLVRSIHAALDRVDPDRATPRTEQDYLVTQRSVWSEIQNDLSTGQVASPFWAYLDLVKARPVFQKELLDRFQPVAGSVGVAIVRGGRIVAVDCFGSPGEFEAAGPLEIVASHVPVAGDPAERPDVNAALGDLGRFQGSAPSTATYLTDAGGGVSLQVRSGDVLGSILCSGGWPVHVFMVDASR